MEPFHDEFVICSLLEMKSLEEQLQDDLLDITDQAMSLRYYPTRFIQMIHESGALVTAKSLLRDSDIQAGLMRLWELGRLDLSLEAQVLQPKYTDLFSPEERRSARERLEKMGWKL